MAGGEHTYEEGLREGRLRGIEETIVKHAERLDKHDLRLTSQEKISYAVLGAVFLIQVLPAIKQLFML